MHRELHETNPSAIQAAYATGRVKRILLMEFGRIGDLLFITPAIRALKRRFPRARFDLLTSEYAQQVVAGSPHLDRVFTINNRGWHWRLFRQHPLVGRLGREGHDLAITFRWKPDFERILLHSGIPRIFCGTGVPTGAGIHMARAYLDQLAPLGVEDDGEGMEVAWTGEDEAAVEAWLQERNLAGRPLLVGHPGSYEIRRSVPQADSVKRIWPPDRWGHLVDRLGRGTDLAPVLTGFTRGEHRLCREVLATASAPAHPYPVESLNGLACLLSRAAVFVCGDTGPLHLASAVGVPTVALFGPSRPARTGPWRNRGGARVLQHRLPCAPCRGRRVPCHNNQCMQVIEAEEVLRAVASLRAALPFPT